MVDKKNWIRNAISKLKDLFKSGGGEFTEFKPYQDIWVLEKKNEGKISVTVVVTKGLVQDVELHGANNPKTEKESNSKLVITGSVEDKNSNNVQLKISANQPCKYKLEGRSIFKFKEKILVENRI